MVYKIRRIFFEQFEFDCESELILVILARFTEIHFLPFLHLIMRAFVVGRQPKVVGKVARPSRLALMIRDANTENGWLCVQTGIWDEVSEKDIR